MDLIKIHLFHLSSVTAETDMGMGHSSHNFRFNNCFLQITERIKSILFPPYINFS